MRILSKIFATVFGLGYFPVAPGTITSLGIIFLYKFIFHPLSWPLHMLIFIFIFLLGVFTSQQYSQQQNKKDPQNIVIDEAAGQFLVLFRLDPSWTSLLIAFFLFRFFDIVKPFPIRKTEKLPHGWGIMMDDVVAAVFAGIITNIYLLLK